MARAATRTTEASITKTRPPCQWQGGLFHTRTPGKPYGTRVFALCGGRFFLGVGGRNTERKGGCRSAPPCVPPLSLCRSDPGSFSPSGFRRRPRWGQLKPSGALPVGGDFIAQQETPVKGAAHGFAATPLTGISRCAFCESPTEQIAQRACSRHEPTRWGEAAKREPRKGALIYHFVASCGGGFSPQGRTYIPPWVVSCVLGSLGERNTTFRKSCGFAKGLLRPKFSARLKH